MARDTLARPNNRKYLEDLVRQYGVRPKLILETDLLKELRELCVEDTSGSSDVSF
jgi:hypothetical protein